MNILLSARSAGHSNHTQTQAQGSAGNKEKNFFKPIKVLQMLLHMKI